MKRSPVVAAGINLAQMTAVLAGIIVLFSLYSRNFISLRAFLSIANQVPSMMVIAVGMTFVLLIAGIDLSVGSVMALCGTVLSVALVDWRWGVLPAILACLAAGCVCGAVNGLITAYWAIPSFIVTLGMLEMARGGAYLMTASRTKYIGSSIDVISEPLLLGISLAFLAALLIVAVGQLILTRTVFGRYLVGIGTNEETMRLSGIDSRPIKIAVFVFSGLLVAVASIFQCSRLEAADPNAGAGLELRVIAAVVIGGTSPLGGRGSVLTTFFGVLILSSLEYGLDQIGATDPVKRLITGGVIISAVILDLYRKGLRRS
jgi:ribose transport system permease protein